MRTPCDKCKNKTCKITSTPCKKIEILLKAEGIKSKDWIRPKVASKNRSDGLGKWREIPMSSLNGWEHWTYKQK